MSKHISPPPPAAHTGRGASHPVLPVVLAYVAFASLWILLSDWAVEALFRDPRAMVLASTLKGWLFVALTSLLLYGVMQRNTGSAAGAAHNGDLLRWPFLLSAAAIAALVGIGVARTVAYHQKHDIAQLQALADIKTRQMDDWLRERTADAEFTQTSQFLAEQYHRWQDAGDAASRTALQARLEQLRRSRGYDAVTLLSPRAERLWGTPRAPLAVTPAVEEEARLAAADRKLRCVGPYRDAAGRTRLDFIAPLTGIPGSSVPLVVLHVDPEDRLFPTLQAWSAPSGSGEALLIRRDGDQVVFLNALRHRKDTAAKMRLPLASKELLAARALRGETGHGGVLRGRDYRNVSVIGVVRAIPGTDWLLVVKMDRSELYGDALPDAIWIALAGVLALFVAGAAAHLRRLRRHLDIADQVQQSQAERLRALYLLDAIASSSTDAIFAKDRDGRYLLCNAEAARFIGKTPEEIIGRDDTALFTPEQAARLMADDRMTMANRRPVTVQEALTTALGDVTFLVTKGPLYDAEGEIIGLFGVAHNITERTKAETALQQSEARYRSLFDNLLNSVVYARMIFENDIPVDIEYLAVNPAFSTVTGIEGEVVGRRVSDVIPGYCRDNPESLAVFGRVARSGEATRWEHYLGALDRWLSFIVYSPARDEVVIVAENITQRKKAELALRKLSQAVEQSPESIIITDLDANIEFVNEAFLRVSGYARDEVLGQNSRMLRSGDTPASVYRQMWAALGRGDVWEGEFINRRKNGEIYTEFARISPVREPDGRITHFLAIKENITERKRTEDAIRASKALLQCVIDSTPDWIVVKDSEHRFMLVNQAFAKAFSQTPEGMVGRCDTDFLPIEMSAGNADKGVPNAHDDDNAILGGASIHHPYDKVRFENGEVRVFDTFKGPLRDRLQKVYGSLTYRRDITQRYNTEQEQKVLETQLRQAQKMELIGHLTGGIAHDFNNILAAIFGYAELAQMSTDPKTNPQLSLYLQEILQAGIRAKELVSQLLTFSRKKETATEPIAIAPIVREVTKLLHSTMPASISIKTTVAKELPEALISSVHLHQILMNLGVNARDAIAGNGTIEVKAEAVLVDGSLSCDSCHQNFSGAFLMISVKDSGSGIPPQNLSRIFDPFFTTKEVGAGSGLGLSVLHGIVHSANGHIQVLTELGNGTEFRIFLPAHSSATEHPANGADPRSAAAPVRGHVLVVDDEASIVSFMTTLLEHLGCTVTGLTSATEALRRFHEDPHGVDLVITDQTMPDMTGAELARAMLARRPELPIVLTTGYSSAIGEDAARRIGIRRFLVKPVPAKILSDLIAECLAAKR